MTQRRMASWLRYVGEYLPGKQGVGAMDVGCSGPWALPFIILSGLYMAVMAAAMASVASSRATLGATGPVQGVAGEAGVVTGEPA